MFHDLVVGQKGGYAALAANKFDAPQFLEAMKRMKVFVDNKWLAALATDVQSELDRVSQALTGRIRQLADRYAKPLPQMTEEVKTLAARVNEHLKKMGAVWN